MNKPTNKRMTILIAILVVLVGFFVYRYYSERDTDAPVSVAPVSAEQSAIGKELLNTLFKLKSVKLDSEFFSDGAFASLKDFSKTLPQEAVGRRNPFAPIGLDSLGQQATSSSRR
jgi:hypothetical protein